MRPMLSRNKGIAGIALAMVLGLCPVVRAEDPRIGVLEDKPLAEFQPPAVQIHDFPNGIRLYFLRDSELPFFNLSGRFAVGSIHDPVAKRGLLAMTMNLIQTGGNQHLAPDEVDKRLEQVAATISAWAGREYAYVGASSLTRDQDMVLDLLFDQLLRPAFDPERFKIAQKAVIDNIQRRNEQPKDIASREFPQALYGETSVWAQEASLDSIQAITREDLIAHHQKIVAPNRFWIAISANMSFADAIAAIEKRTRDWAPKTVVLPPIPSLKKEWQPSIQFIDQPHNQSTVIMGHFGEKRFNPDKYALILANFILGGSTFSSRLGSHIRSTLGLTYSINSSFDFDTEYGAFKIGTSTKSETTEQIIKASLQIVREMLTTQPITQQELDTAKETILSQLIFQFETPEEIVNSRLDYDFFGYPPDYLEIFQRKLKAITVEQVNQVLKKYIFPDRMIMMIVGNKQTVGSLKSLGNVVDRPLDLE